MDTISSAEMTTPDPLCPTPSFVQIAQNGTYYYPAYTHYTLSIDKPRSVRCDKCNRTQLRACIGYGEYDLCLPCCDQIVSSCMFPVAIPQPTGPIGPHPARPFEPFYIPRNPDTHKFPPPYDHGPSPYDHVSYHGTEPMIYRVSDNIYRQRNNSIRDPVREMSDNIYRQRNNSIRDPVREMSDNIYRQRNNSIRDPVREMSDNMDSTSNNNNMTPSEQRYGTRPDNIGVSSSVLPCDDRSLVGPPPEQFYGDKSLRGPYDSGSSSVQSSRSSGRQYDRMDSNGNITKQYY